MANDEEREEKKLHAMKRPRPSEIRRHGFGSPQGMEMTDIPPPRAASKPEATQGQPDQLQSPSTTLDSSQSASPLEVASTIALATDSTPPSVAVAPLGSRDPNVAETQTPNISQLGSDTATASASFAPVPKESETPKKLGKRRLFFTPSRRKSKPTPPRETTMGVNPIPNRQQAMPMPNPTSPRTIQQQHGGSTPPLSSTTTATDTPRPKSQLPLRTGSTGPVRSSRKSSGRLLGQRRRQTGAPMPTGLSGYSTPRSGRRRQPPTSSGRRGFNPLERISDIFSPQSPNFSPASPITSDVVLPEGDNDLNDSSFSDTSSASGSVKEPFAEQVERLDQLLATPSQQLGELAFTTTDKDNYGSDDDLDDEMEGLESSRRLLAEELSRVDYSLIGRGASMSHDDEEVGRTPESTGKATAISKSPSPKKKSSDDKQKDIDWVPLLEVEANHPPNFSPDPVTARIASISEDDDDDEDRKPAAKEYQSPDKKKPPPMYTPEKLKKSFEGKKYSPLYTPPRPLSGGSEEIMHSTAGGSADKEGGDKKAERKIPDDEQEGALRMGTPSPQSTFDPFGLAALSSESLFSGSEDSIMSPASSTDSNKNIYQSFLKFAKHFSDDGRYLGKDLTATKNVEHSRRVLEYLNTVFPTVENESRNTVEENLPTTTPNRGAVPRNEAQTTEKDISVENIPKGDENERFGTPHRDIELTEKKSFALSPLSQDSGDDIPLLGSRADSKAPEANLKSSKATKIVSDTNESKPSKLDTSVFVPILSDDSDDNIIFHKDSPQSLITHGIGAPAPGEKDTGFKKFKSEEMDQRGNLSLKCYPSKSKQKRGLLIVGILLILTGIGLVIRAVLVPNGGETLAPSTSVTFTPTEEAKPAPISLTPMPSVSPSGMFSVPSFQPSTPPSLSPSMLPSETTSTLPTRKDSVPSFQPPTKTKFPLSLSPSTVLSESPSVLPTLKGSKFPTISPSIPPVPTATFLPSGNSLAPFMTPLPPSRISSIPSVRPSSPNPSTVPPKEPSFSPTRKGSGFETTTPSILFVPSPLPPSRISSTPSLHPSANKPTPSSPNPSMPSKEPSTSPTQRSESPTETKIISFTVPYKIFIRNGLVDLVPQSEYVPELISSMDLLSADILLNIVRKRKKPEDESSLTEVVLPTSIIRVIDLNCPEDIENGLCQGIIAEISLLNAEDSWQRFRDTAELAIEIGRLQYNLERVDPNSPVEVIDSLWTPPPPAIPVGTPTNDPSSHMASNLSPTPPPTTSLSSSPTSLPLINFLQENSFDGGLALRFTSSPQYRAYSWLRNNKQLHEYSERQLLQRYSMATLYYATNGNEWLVNTSWLSDEPECAWFGKTDSKNRCNQRGELMNLELDLNNLNGLLPPELGLLSSSLEIITLGGGPNSNLLGTLPTEIGYLTQLKVFVLQNNNLSGTIPPEIKKWKKLEKMDLSQNRFQGEFPTQIGILSELTFFDISTNKFSGSLPSELGHLRKCQMMFFEDNAIASSIPTEIGGLIQLKELKGGSNKFESLPTELGNLKSAEFISFQDSSITGPIPTELGNLRKLRYLKLENNALTGSIPSELARIESLQNKLDLSNNQLSGTLPTELGLFVDLRVIKLNNNFLSGIIPSELSQMSQLTSIQLNSNDFSGTIPTAVCETFNVTYPAFQTDCGDFDDNCPCCTICCIDGTCTCRYMGTSKEFLCSQRK